MKVLFYEYKSEYIWEIETNDEDMILKFAKTGPKITKEYELGNFI